MVIKRPPHGISGGDQQRAEHGRRKTNRQGRAAKGGHAGSHQVNVERLAAIIGREIERVLAGQHLDRIQAVEGFVLVEPGRDLPQLVETQQPAQGQDDQQDGPGGQTPGTGKQ